MRSIAYITEISKAWLLPPHGIGDGIAEEGEEGGLEEGVELGEGLAALGPQGVRRIQNPRDPLLLRQRRKWDLEIIHGSLGYMFQTNTAVRLLDQAIQLLVDAKLKPTLFDFPIENIDSKDVLI